MPVVRWTAIADIIIGTIDNNEDIRKQSYLYLEGWRKQSINLYTKAKPDELDRIKRVYGLACQIHDEKKYFNYNPIRGLGFYLGIKE